ncbi:LysR family transcriptional regulator [Roseococcus sp. YIM B11640]|uniref:LysR family transcriptional regulator n=1 Tax=Roseococcus sp. YIM B11640 TaxID=3133973 RepID=UPI003C7C2FA1
MDLNLVRLFAEIVEAQGLAEAARRLAMSRSAVSRGLQQLERGLGTQLLRRTTRRLELTSAGQVFLEHAQNMLREAEAARASVEGLGSTLRGNLRVSLPTGLGRMLLGPAMLGFAKAHPQVTLRVAFSNRVPDLVGAQIDIAIRVIAEPPADYVARRLGQVRWRLVAAPAYLAGRAIAAPADLLAHDLIAPPPTDGRRYALTLARGAEPAETLGLVPRIASEDFNFLLAALLAGTGFGALPDYAVADALGSGALVEVLPGHALRGLPDRIFALTTPNRYRPAAVGAMLDWAAAALSDGP